MIIDSTMIVVHACTMITANAYTPIRVHVYCRFKLMFDANSGRGTRGQSPMETPQCLTFAISSSFLRPPGTETPGTQAP